MHGKFLSFSFTSIKQYLGPLDRREITFSFDFDKENLKMQLHTELRLIKPFKIPHNNAS